MASDYRDSALFQQWMTLRGTPTSGAGDTSYGTASGGSSGQQGDYIAPKVGGYIPSDLWNYAAGPQAIPRGFTRSKFKSQVVYEDAKMAVIYSRFDAEDLGGGLNRQRGNMEDDWDRIAASTAETRFFKTLTLHYLQNIDTTPDIGGTVVGLHSLNIYDRLYLAGGSTSGSALFDETSATDSSVRATDYIPPSSITGLYPVVIGGAGTAMRMAITHATDPPKIVTVSGTTATTAATMHANLDNSWGIAQGYTYTDATHYNPIQIYTNTGISLLYETDAATAAPTLALSFQRGGGYYISLLQLGSGPHRHFYVMPKEPQTGGMLAAGAEKPGEVISVNQLGTDMQREPVGLDDVYFCIAIGRTGLAASDKRRVTLFTGNAGWRDLGWVGEREPNSAFTHFEVRGLGTNGNELFVHWNHVSFDTANNTVQGTDIYDLETNAWHRGSAETSIGTAFARSTACTDMKISVLTRAIHQYSVTQWKDFFVGHYGENPFWMYRKTSAGGTGSGKTFEPTGTMTTAAMDFPGLEGWPSILARTIFMGDIDAGNASDNTTPTTITWDVANHEADFATVGKFKRANFQSGKGNIHQITNFDNNRDVFYRFQAKCTITQGSGGTDPTRYAPNALPVAFEFYTKVDKSRFSLSFARQMGVLR